MRDSSFFLLEKNGFFYWKIVEQYETRFVLLGYKGGSNYD